MRYIIMFFMSLSVTSCGLMRLSNLENMNSSDRQFQLSTKTNDELCNIFNNVFIKPETEKQVAEILKEREVKECNALHTKRIIPSSKHEKFIKTTTKTEKNITNERLSSSQSKNLPTLKNDEPKLSEPPVNTTTNSTSHEINKKQFQEKIPHVNPSTFKNQIGELE